MTNYTVATEQSVKSIVSKQPPQIKSADKKNELDKQDLSIGATELMRVINQEEKEER